MKSKRVIILVVSIVAIAMIAFFAIPTRQNVHKLLMPGKYKILCQPGSYTCWYFWRWLSKGIDKPKQDVEVIIENEQNAKLKLDTSIGNVNEIDRGDRTGCQKFAFDVEKSGSFRISCTEACVLVVMPTNLQYHSLGSMLEFPGAGDDKNFDLPQNGAPSE
ncbi:MAG: hypothetical protein K2Y39_01200 [Candidatus Obscuribacterales bacterium]|nr:hypothetical protein [Candidatus Obscuribacterales bacterium]